MSNQQPDADGCELKLYTRSDCEVELKRENLVFLPDETEQSGIFQTDEWSAYFLVICRNDAHPHSSSAPNREQIDSSASVNQEQHTFPDASNQERLDSPN